MGLLQLKVEVMCDAGFQPTNPDVIVTIGKEHLSWWNIYPEQSAVQLQCKADYDVSDHAKLTFLHQINEHINDTRSHSECFY